MTDLERIKAAPDRVARQESDDGIKVSRIVWSSAKLGLKAVENMNTKEKEKTNA